MDVIKPPIIDLDTFNRTIYPGVLAAGFAYWRHQKSLPVIFGGLDPVVIFAIIVIILGIAIYILYRGLFYEPLMKALEKFARRTSPLLRYHEGIIQTIGQDVRGILRDIETANACASYVITTKHQEYVRSAYGKFNSYVHLLFLSSFIFLLFAMHDFCSGQFIQFADKWICYWAIWFVLSMVFLCGGLRMDKQADTYTVVLVQAYEYEYMNRLRSLVRYLNDPASQDAGTKQ